MGTAYILAFSPLGPFGAYHYYLGNWPLGLIYTFTIGIFGIGWIVDLFRMKKLVKAAKTGLNKRSVGTAYIMATPPFGLFGAYHYYLGNYALGIVHTCTLGIFGIGWVVDLFRMKGLVAAANDTTHDHGMTKITAYVLCVSPLGIFGAHHFYLERYLNGGLYVGTLGMFGFGWIFDWFRLPVLYERYASEDEHRYPDEAYMYWFPLGIFGLHHFYLGNKRWGIIYLCTFGCLLIGWIIDGFRLVFLIRDHNGGVSDPDMNNFRICRPNFKQCSLYSCRRRCFSLCTACTCLESFSLSRKSETEEGESENDVNRNSKVRDDFDVIQEMYPNENGLATGAMKDGNWSKASMLNNYDPNDEGIATVEGEGYTSYPNSEYPNYGETENSQGYDFSAYPGDNNIATNDTETQQVNYNQGDYDQDVSVRHHEVVNVNLTAEEENLENYTAEQEQNTQNYTANGEYYAQNYTANDEQYGQNYAPNDEQNTQNYTASDQQYDAQNYPANYEQYTQSQNEMYNESWTDENAGEVDGAIATIDNAIDQSEATQHM